MIATSYTVTHPDRPNVTLRLHAQPIASLAPLDILKVNLQATKCGHPIAEDPLETEWMTPSRLEEFIEQRRADGWVIVRVGMKAKDQRFTRKTPQHYAPRKVAA